jgi:hypothetical protein
MPGGGAAGGARLALGGALPEAAGLTVGLPVGLRLGLESGLGLGLAVGEALEVSRVQPLAAGLGALPGAQGAHHVEPSAGEYDPASHGVQLPDLGALAKVPGGHRAQGTVPPAEACPAGQGLQIKSYPMVVPAGQEKQASADAAPPLFVSPGGQGVGLSQLPGQKKPGGQVCVSQPHPTVSPGPGHTEPVSSQ